MVIQMRDIMDTLVIVENVCKTNRTFQLRWFGLDSRIVKNNSGNGYSLRDLGHSC